MYRGFFKINFVCFLFCFSVLFRGYFGLKGTETAAAASGGEVWTKKTL